MSARSERTILAAAEVAEFLDGIGERKRANDIRNLCRSNDSFRLTLAQLHKDNMELRAMLAAREPQSCPPNRCPRF